VRIARELYLGITLDREKGRVTVMASSEGGVDIEEVAREHPEKILRAPVDPLIASRRSSRKMAFALGLQGDSVNAFVKFATGLYAAFAATDATLAEINPLVVSAVGAVIALDAKLNFDDNALYRHPDVAAMRDPGEEDPKETQAKEFDLSYIALDGDIGCMVNGAGLAMATMDVIKLAGGSPANFLDVGGGADESKVTAAFKIILQDPNVKAVLVNIFGGIMKCDVIANGVVAAAKQVGLDMPLVVRLQGTNVELATRSSRRAASTSSRPTTWATPPRRWSPRSGPSGSAARRFAREHPRRSQHPGGRAGHHRLGGSFHTEQMIAYGTQVVAGVTPGRGGTRFQGEVPIFNTVEQAVRETGANAAAIFVPPRSPPTPSWSPPTPACRSS